MNFDDFSFKFEQISILQFMKQKLLRSRLTGGNEQVESISEEEKKMIALGTVS